MKVALEGMVVLITGGARGIGAKIAREAAAAGAEALVLLDRDPCRFRPALRDRNGHCRSRPARCAGRGYIGGTDPLRPDRRSGERRRSDDAGGLWGYDGRDLEPDVLGQHARAVFFLMDGAIADMKARGQPGSIVNILSMNAHCGVPDLAVYSATKGALLTLTKNAANAHLAGRIRVNGINLGWTDTETERHLHAVTLGRGEGWLDARAAEMPLGRLISAGDCARQARLVAQPGLGADDGRVPRPRTERDRGAFLILGTGRRRGAVPRDKLRDRPRFGTARSPPRRGPAAGATPRRPRGRGDDGPAGSSSARARNTPTCRYRRNR